jgi:hypothetical protein
LQHARRFSYLIYGAAVVYNHALARLKNWEERIEELSKEYKEWISDKAQYGIAKWDMRAFWEAVYGHGYTITARTKAFVEEWRGLFLGGGQKLIDREDAVTLVRRRELDLKKTRSRFQNSRMLDQWQGSSALYVLSYRWPTVSRLLGDLHHGLQGR